MEVLDSVEYVDNLADQIAYRYYGLNQQVILGVDCEGILRNSPLSLIQIYFDGTAYIIDLLVLGHIPEKLARILQDENIIKVFHDFCEDSAALVGHYGVECNSVFDTQIARRIQAEYGKKSFKHNNIGLNKLLEEVLNVNNSKKSSIQEQMKKNNAFWNIRPLTEEMIEYAGQDVIYLPSLFTKMVERLNKVEAQMNYSQNSLSEQVYLESVNYNKYGRINREVQSLEIGQNIKALVRSFNKSIIFCSLNLGLTGIIKDPKSFEFTKKNHRIGDILDVTVHSASEDRSRLFLYLPSYFEHNESKDNRDSAKHKVEKKSNTTSSLKDTKREFYPSGHLENKTLIDAKILQEQVYYQETDYYQDYPEYTVYNEMQEYQYEYPSEGYPGSYNYGMQESPPLGQSMSQGSLSTEFYEGSMGYAEKFHHTMPTQAVAHFEHPVQTQDINSVTGGFSHLSVDDKSSKKLTLKSPEFKKKEAPSKLKRSAKEFVAKAKTSSSTKALPTVASSEMTGHSNSLSEKSPVFFPRSKKMKTSSKPFKKISSDKQIYDDRTKDESKISKFQACKPGPFTKEVAPNSGTDDKLAMIGLQSSKDPPEGERGGVILH